MERILVTGGGGVHRLLRGAAAGGCRQGSRDPGCADLRRPLGLARNRAGGPEPSIGAGRHPGRRSRSPIILRSAARCGGPSRRRVARGPLHRQSNGFRHRERVRNGEPCSRPRSTIGAVLGPGRGRASAFSTSRPMKSTARSMAERRLPNPPHAGRPGESRARVAAPLRSAGGPWAHRPVVSRQPGVVAGDSRGGLRSRPPAGLPGG